MCTLIMRVAPTVCSVPTLSTKDVLRHPQGLMGYHILPLDSVLFMCWIIVLKCQKEVSLALFLKIGILGVMLKVETFISHLILVVMKDFNFDLLTFISRTRTTCAYYFHKVHVV